MAKKTKKKTFSEFMAWIEGVESMQSEDWVPNSEQWKKIRLALNNVIPDEVEIEVIKKEAPMRVGQPVQAVPMAPTMTPAVPVPQGPILPQDQASSFEGVAQKPRRAPVPSAVAQQVRSDLPADRQMPATKTADIDTSDGNYQSDLI